MSSAPMPPQAPRPSNAVWWILGIIGALLVLMVAASLLVAGYFLRHSRIQESGDKVDIQTPVGEIKVDKTQPHVTGLPVYPGATPSPDKGASVEILSAVKIAVEKYVSDDAEGKVEDWYRKRLGPEFRVETGHARVNWDRDDRFHFGDADYAFVDDRDDAARVVALRKRGDVTEITLFRTGEKELQ